MLDTNPSLILRGINDVAIEERPIPEIGPSEVLIEMKKTGICGTDVHYLTHGRVGDFILKDPITLGHEPAGIVCKVGSEVEHLKVGSRVALEPGVTCRKCDVCKRGHYQICPFIKFAANPPEDGTLCRYFKLPADLAYPIPDNLTYEDGAMIEPLAVAVHAVLKVGLLKADENIVVFGSGPVGLMCMAVAKACGASRIIAVDLVQSKLDFALQYAATDTFIPPRREPNEGKIEYSRRAATLMSQQLGIPDQGQDAIDLVLDASGAEACVETGLFIVKRGGTFVQVGLGVAEMVLPITLILVRELVIKGAFRFGPGDYPTAIRLVAQGKINLDALVTHRFAFTDSIAAFEATKKGTGADGKAVIKAIISAPDVDPLEK